MSNLSAENVPYTGTASADSCVFDWTPEEVLGGAKSANHSTERSPVVFESDILPESSGS